MSAKVKEIIEKLNENRQILFNTLEKMKILFCKIDDSIDLQTKTIDNLEKTIASFEVQDIVQKIRANNEKH